MASASDTIAKLNLIPHLEDGFYSATYRDSSITLSTSQLPPQYKVDRAVSSCIYFLLKSGNVSRFHRIPCAETWHFCLAEPITQPQYTVSPNVWFGAFPTKDLSISANGRLIKAGERDGERHYSLVGHTCAPASEFQDLELAKRSDLVSRFPIVGFSYPSFPTEQKLVSIKSREKGCVMLVCIL